MDRMRGREGGGWQQQQVGEEAIVQRDGALSCEFT